MHTSVANYNALNHERGKVRELIPEFLESSAANLISFMEQYYEYLNREGYASYELSHVIDENDIDVTSAKYLDAIQGEIAKIVPNSNVVDRNTLYKRIVHYYRIKGTDESIKVFFQVMFDSFVDVYYPGDNLFKLSTGTYDTTASSYSKDGSFLSGVDKIQDSDFWQDFSYQIQSDVTADQWENSYNRLVHPAGMKFFALVLLETVVESRWDRIENYEAVAGDQEAFLENLTPPRIRSLNSYDASHTPTYQLGWLSQILRALVEAVAETQNDDEIQNPYRNNISLDPVAHNFRAPVSLTDVSSSGFSADFSDSGSTGVGAVVIPLNIRLRRNQQIKIGFTIEYGSSYSISGDSDKAVITLLKDRADTGIAVGSDSTIMHQTGGRCLGLLSDTLQTGDNGIQLNDQTDDSPSNPNTFEVVLHSTDDENQAVAFLVPYGSNRTIEIRDFRVIDFTDIADPNEFPIREQTIVLSPGESSELSVATYNRKFNFQRDVIYKSRQEYTAENTRDEIAFDNYFPTTSFWDDERSLADLGYLNVPFSELLTHANSSAITNPYEPEIRYKTVTFQIREFGSTAAAGNLKFDHLDSRDQAIGGQTFSGTTFVTKSNLILKNSTVRPVFRLIVINSNGDDVEFNTTGSVGYVETPVRSGVVGRRIFEFVYDGSTTPVKLTFKSV